MSGENLTDLINGLLKRIPQEKGKKKNLKKKELITVIHKFRRNGWLQAI